VIFSQEDDPRGITIRDQMVVTFRPKTALIQREKAEGRAVRRGAAPIERRTARIRATKEAVKGSLKAGMLVNSQAQLLALIISFSFICSHLAMCSAVALCFNIIGNY
jgi:hypothetical protein